jgi:hypothetical protein
MQNQASKQPVTEPRAAVVAAARELYSTAEIVINHDASEDDHYRVQLALGDMHDALAALDAVGAAGVADEQSGASESEPGQGLGAVNGSPSALVVLLAAIERAQTESLRASSAEIYKAHRNHNRYLLRLSRRLGEMADEVARIIAPEANVEVARESGENRS